MKGKTTRTFPKLGYRFSFSGVTDKGKLAVCYVLTSLVGMATHIASFCATHNHWSDDITSRAYVKDVAVPYFRRKIEAERSAAAAEGRAPTCKEFGEQKCVLIVDCWWGWLDAGFRNYVKSNYPWIRLIFVPARCTPKAQPMDGGVIAKIKAILRKSYSKWAVDLTVEHLNKGGAPSEVKVPTDVRDLQD